METLNARAWIVVVSVLSALLVAAALRHALHVHAGYTREEIRLGALIGLLLAAAACVAFSIGAKRSN